MFLKTSHELEEGGKEQEGHGHKSNKRLFLFIHFATMSLTVFIFVASQVKKHTVVHAVFNTSELKELSHC